MSSTQNSSIQLIFFSNFIVRLNFYLQAVKMAWHSLHLGNYINWKEIHLTEIFEIDLCRFRSIQNWKVHAFFAINWLLNFWICIDIRKCIQLNQ